MEPIVYGQFFNGQSALGKLEQSKYYSMTNCDVHSETGLVMPQLAMASESTVPNEACFNAIDPSGNVYFFSKSTGKTWKRTTAGSYSLVNTNANGAHTHTFTTASAGTGSAFSIMNPYIVVYRWVRTA